MAEDDEEKLVRAISHTLRARMDACMALPPNTRARAKAINDLYGLVTELCPDHPTLMQRLRFVIRRNIPTIVNCASFPRVVTADYSDNLINAFELFAGKRTCRWQCRRKGRPCLRRASPDVCFQHAQRERKTRTALEPFLPEVLRNITLQFFMFPVEKRS